jgi:hypothetical protein
MFATGAARAAKPAGQAGPFTRRTTPPAHSAPSATDRNHDGRVPGSRPGEAALLAGALIARLVRAFLAIPSPVRPHGPALRLAGLGMGPKYTELAGKTRAGAQDDGGRTA